MLQNLVIVICSSRLIVNRGHTDAEGPKGLEAPIHSTIKTLMSFKVHDTQQPLIIIQPLCLSSMQPTQEL